MPNLTRERFHLNESKKTRGFAALWAIFGLWTSVATLACGEGISARVELLDGKSAAVENLSLDSNWSFRGVYNRQPFAASAENALAIRFSNRVVPVRPRGYKILLNDGGWLGAGSLAMKDEIFKLRSDSLGEVSVPAANVRAFILDPEASTDQIERLLALASATDAKNDRILYRNGDLAMGSILEIDEHSVAVEKPGDGKNQRLGRELVLGVALDPSLAGKVTKPEIHGLLRLSDGNVFTVTSIEGKSDSLVVKTNFGATVRVAASDLVDVAIRGGKLIYLSDLKPVLVEAENYLGQKIAAYETDRSAAGSALTVGGRTFAKGLGARSESRMVYDIDSFSRFEAIVGLDQRAGELANVRFQVVVDGTAVFDSGEMTVEDAPKEIRLDVKGKKKLELLVGFARNADAEDFADWCDARLVK